MKLVHEVRGDTVHASIEGDLEASSCDCLRNFWTLRLAPAARIDVDLSGAETGDGEGVAALVSLVHDSLRDGRRVVLRDAPQMVAHGLYQVGLLREGSKLRLVDPRHEEPYAG